MSKKLYVGNLPFTVNSDKLKELFSAYGELAEVSVIAFKDTGKSKGFCIVTINDDAQAEKAIQEMNGKEIEGRALRVNEAQPFDPSRPRPPRHDGGGGRFGGGGGRGFSRGPREFRPRSESY